AHGAVQPHLVDAEAAAPGNADRQVLARLADETKGRIPLRQLVAADGWQRREYPVGRQGAANRSKQAPTWLAPDRPVLEVIFDRLVGHRSIGRDRDDGPDAGEYAQYHDGEAKERERAPHRCLTAGLRNVSGSKLTSGMSGVAGSGAIQTRALRRHQVDSSRKFTLPGSVFSV